MLSHDIMRAIMKANVEVLNEDLPDQGVVSDTRFVREDWVKKAIENPRRLQRLIQRGDIFPVETKVSKRFDWKAVSGYVFNDTPRGGWAYRTALERVSRAYDFSEVM